MLSEDLSEFEDYLKEFEASIFFDSEICPACGINLSGSVSTVNRAFTEIEFESISKKKFALEKIKNSGIRIRENIPQENSNEDLTLFIWEDDIKKLKELLSEE